MNQNSSLLTIRIRRDADRTDAFQLPYEPGLSVLWALKYIYENLDRSVAYPLCLCRIGKCGNCLLRVNGKAQLACSVILREGDDLLLEPLDAATAIRDLVKGSV